MSLLDAAEEAALIEAVRRTAAAEITPLFRALGAGQVGSKSAPDDLVTVADTAAEAALTAAVDEILPTAQVIGEEAVSANPAILAKAGAPGLTVVIDPIDGTWNYAHGLAVYGVIVAVLRDGQTIFSLLYDPTGDDWVIARAGGGAWFGGAERPPERISVADDPGAAAHSFGFVALNLFSKPDQALIARTLPQFLRTQSLRCSCHEYRQQAQGHVAFGLNGALMPWDHAAGVLALREAGGVARLLDGRAYAPTLHEGLLLTAVSERLWHELADLWEGLFPQA
ncbi:MAG: inositol monophosphatase [Pseudomonadota bacterium]